MENYKFFNDPYKFSGKHARMVSELWSLNDYEHSYFKRLIDIYIVAAILGFRIDRKAKRDYAPVEQRTVFGEQMRQASEDLEFILQMMLLLEPAGQGIHEECIRRAFKGVETEEEFKRYNELFESYMLGGVEELYIMINDYLSGEFEVTAFNDGMSAIQKITSYDEYALALIDLMLPDISGMEIIKIIRKVSKIPIIIITAKDNDIDKSLGLNLGADDYVVKPFSLIELTARIKANIRRARTYQALPNNSIIKIKDIEIDPHSHMVQRKGVTIDLTPIEFQILYILASHPGQAYSKERLYELIWKEPYFGNENVLNTHINRLRLKLKSNAEDSTAYVKTLWGIGYKMEEK